MQKFLIVNCKGVSLELAIMQLHQQLNKLHGEPDTADLEIFSVNFVNTFETPKKTLDISPAANQPVIVYNCCAILVKPRQLFDIDQLADAIADAVVNKLDPPGEPDELAGPSAAEIETLKHFAGFTCKHENLDPAKHSKAYKNPGMYYQVCEDCGNEVWFDNNGEQLQPKMFVVPSASDQLAARIQDEQDPES